jgi:ElaB/YqjD/DUF883 family membrane-anchored ribosome-binding protein
MVEQAKSDVSDAASTVQEKAGELKQQGRGKLREALDQYSNQAGGQAKTAAGALRQSGTQLRTQGESGSQQLAGLFEGAASRAEGLGGYLERTSGDRMLHDVEDFARRRPWAVAGLGLVVGLAASRFVKASSERRYGQRRQQGTLPMHTRYGAAYGAGARPYESAPYSSGTYETGSSGWSYRTEGNGGFEGEAG